ncbi:hypothetical protein COV19_07690 [Candidatus Woesearchaeota archaeon CG10_big_fil_rev_8_21_14_0_10_44_13]|nr:MAG: hypothetical protein COV19_07690 [Candidatus Woesearchaeota archaeon CG10_big_fil_rev_8_21_14_0_10_44_13]
MRKTAPVLFLALLLIACSQQKTDTKTITLKTGSYEVKINAEIADSSDEITQGLMYRESLGKDEGMLFIFPDENYRSFWMKNTLVPLDIVFISGNGTIVDIKEDFEPCRTFVCESYRSKERAMYVLEANGGFAGENGLMIGDSVQI